MKPKLTPAALLHFIGKHRRGVSVADIIAHFGAEGSINSELFPMAVPMLCVSGELVNELRAAVLRGQVGFSDRIIPLVMPKLKQDKSRCHHGAFGVVRTGRKQKGKQND
jgi:hypothetical protein